MGKKDEKQAETVIHPLSLTGGIGRTGGRSKPAVPRPKFDAAYASTLATGWDSYQEAINIDLDPDFCTFMDQLKTDAQAFDLEGERMAFELGSETFQMWPRSSKGSRWTFSNDDFIVMVRPPSMDYCVSVRYSAAGLWEYGLSTLRVRAVAAIQAAGVLKRTAPVRLSRADFAMDFYSPNFTSEMTPQILNQVLCHSSSKKRAYGKAHGDEDVGSVGTAMKVETLTIGSKAGLQIQVYDKGREIVEMSGKEWMIDLWRRTGYEAPSDGRPVDVWRLEVRFGKLFLKNRNIRNFETLTDNFERLMTEALVTRRLCQPRKTDSNNRRWPIHQLWLHALRQVESADMVPLGRYVTGKRDELRERLVRQTAGLLRTTSVLMDDEYTDGQVIELFEDARAAIRGDKNHGRKVNAARERYRYVSEAG